MTLRGMIAGGTYFAVDDLERSDRGPDGRLKRCKVIPITVILSRARINVTRSPGRMVSTSEASGAAPAAARQPEPLRAGARRMDRSRSEFPQAPLLGRAPALAPAAGARPRRLRRGCYRLFYFILYVEVLVSRLRYARKPKNHFPCRHVLIVD